MSRYNKDLGDFGESIAEEYLKNCGYKILCRNFSVKGGEIDIIATHEKSLIFIEVKTRTSQKYGYPSEAVNRKKLEHMRCAAESYITQNPTDADVRFDIIEVYGIIDKGIPQFSEINHIKEIIID